MQCWDSNTRLLKLSLLPLPLDQGLRPLLHIVDHTENLSTDSETLNTLSLFPSIKQLTVNFLIIKFCQWLMVYKATALPTVSQPLPHQ